MRRQQSVVIPDLANGDHAPNTRSDRGREIYYERCQQRASGHGLLGKRDNPFNSDENVLGSEFFYEL
ncbi:MAG TPA: hypothetical protein VEX18_16290, partial [Polyangiaceae bacterium]|nr:hypothetical protein [Polyangiaceae bacterium]